MKNKITKMSTQGIFITGTDTGVGKTAVTAALLTLLRRRGVDAVPMKPVQTDCLRRGRELIAPDLDFCLRMAGLRAQGEERNDMCPFRFVPACSPHLAARLARQPIQLRCIMAAYRNLAARHDAVLVEGAGGALAPIGGGRTMLDIMRALDLPVLIVARPGLGTINHTLLTLAAVRAAHLKIAGILFADTQPGRWGQIERDNVETIRRLGQVPIIGHFPFLPALAQSRMTPAAFGAAVRRYSKDWQIKPLIFPK